MSTLIWDKVGFNFFVANAGVAESLSVSLALIQVLTAALIQVLNTELTTLMQMLAIKLTVTLMQVSAVELTAALI